jgi:xylulokinase
MQNTIPIAPDGAPLMNLLSWMDERAAEYVQEKLCRGLIKVEGYSLFALLKFLRITGGMPGKHGKDTVCKLGWLKKFKPDVYDRAVKFLDVKDYAVFLATGNFVTSYDMAYVTWLMDTRDRDQGKWRWSESIGGMFGLDTGKMPELRSSTAVVGNVTDEFSRKTGIPAGLPVVNGSGDMLTSAIGSGAISSGDIHVNVGTAGWVATHHPVKAIDTAHYVGTTASGIPGLFLIISKQETLGAALDWFRGILFPSGKPSSDEIYAAINDEVRKSPAGANRVIFTPWLFGERSPINNPYLRGQFFNLQLSTTRADMCRAVYEGVAFNIRWGLEVVETLSRKKVKPGSGDIRLIGGASKSAPWCQVFADVLQRPVIQMANPQMASAMGAAAIAMVSLGILKDFGDVGGMVKQNARFEPDRSKKPLYEGLYARYRALYDNNRREFKAINR